MIEEEEANQTTEMMVMFWEEADTHTRTHTHAHSHARTLTHARFSAPLSDSERSCIHG